MINFSGVEIKYRCKDLFKYEDIKLFVLYYGKDPLNVAIVSILGNKAKLLIDLKDICSINYDNLVIFVGFMIGFIGEQDKIDDEYIINLKRNRAVVGYSKIIKDSIMRGTIGNIVQDKVKDKIIDTIKTSELDTKLPIDKIKAIAEFNSDIKDLLLTEYKNTKIEYEPSAF